MLLLLCIAIATAIPPSLSWGEEKQQVLILNSYHQGNKWTDDETRGIISVLGSNRPGFRVEIEYMDSKKLAEERYFKQLFDIYAAKYKKIRFDVIIATDDNAFFFLRKYRDRLFPGTPVVFCGVNFFKPSYLSGVKGFTGVNEDADLKRALDTALNLHPKTREVVLITDATETGKRISERFRELIPQYRGATFRILDNLEMNKIQDTVRSLPPDALVFFTFFYRDRAGVFFDYYESNELITGVARVPVYVAWDYSMGHAVGGLMVSGTDQGRVAGELARRILQGEPVDSIPVVMESPNRFMFDYAQMARFKIKPADLPQGSTIINEPPSFYAINKLAVWGVIAAFVTLSIMIVSLMVNINRRKKAEEAFHASRQNYHTLVNNLRVGVYRSSGDLWHGSYLQANPAMLSIFGFDSLDEFAAVPAASLYQNPTERRVFLDEVLAKGYVKDREIAMKTKDGRPIMVSCTTTVQYDEKGGIKWLDGVMEDVTQQKSLEDQLRQAQKMEAIGTLAGGVAHDFNNILTALLGYTDLIKKLTPESDPRWHYLRHIYTCSGKAASLVKGLLAFSRKQLLSPRAVDLNHIVTDIESLLKRILGEDIELRTRFAESPLTIFADSNQMEQVLMNLATNARDAMPAGGTLAITTERVDISPESLAVFEFAKPGAYVLLAVSDTGEGMDAVTQQKIFEPFFTTKEVGRGTGLGLSMVYGTIKQHQGEIKVYSELGKGTVFKIYLPLHLENPETVLPASLEARPIRGGAETILVAEDHADVRNLVFDVLTNNGYQVLQAVDGEDAVQQFKTQPAEIDLVIIDVIMPKLNGKEAVEKMSALKPGIKVLYMSGYTADVIHTKGTIDLDFDFISKPLASPILLRKVREILDR